MKKIPNDRGASVRRGFADGKPAEPCGLALRLTWRAAMRNGMAGRRLERFCRDRGGMWMYAEIVYFEGAHFAHIVLYHEHLRLERLREGWPRPALYGQRVDDPRFGSSRGGSATAEAAALQTEDASREMVPRDGIEPPTP